MKHTILHQDDSSAEAFEDAMRTARDLYGKWQRAYRQGKEDEASEVRQRFDRVASDIVYLLLAAAVVSSDELAAVEAMLHGMRFATPQDEMGG